MHTHHEYVTTFEDILDSPGWVECLELHVQPTTTSPIEDGSLSVVEVRVGDRALLPRGFTRYWLRVSTVDLFWTEDGVFHLDPSRPVLVVVRLTVPEGTPPFALSASLRPAGWMESKAARLRAVSQGLGVARIGFQLVLLVLLLFLGMQMSALIQWFAWLECLLTYGAC